MVEGLELFRDHFKDYADQYVLIGGVACDLALRQAALEFRLTKDLDIVLLLESLNDEFVAAFWQFIKLGKYVQRERESESRKFYRFQKPAVEGYPVILELFSRIPDALSISSQSHLTPIPVDTDISSLSAILLDDAYYAYLKAGRIQIEDIPIVRPEYLIPLKARAWLDLTRRKDEGEGIGSKDIKKHKNDVFRLYQVLEPDLRTNPSTEIKGHLREFLTAMKKESATTNLKNLGLGTKSMENILGELNAYYELDNG